MSVYAHTHICKYRDIWETEVTDSRFCDKIRDKWLQHLLIVALLSHSQTQALPVNVMGIGVCMWRTAAIPGSALRKMGWGWRRD